MSFILIVVSSWLIKPNAPFHSLDHEEYEDLFYPFSLQSIQHCIFEFIIQVLIPIWYTLQSSVTTNLTRSKSVFCPNLDNDHHCPNCVNTLKRLLDAENNMATKDDISNLASQIEFVQDLKDESKYYTNEINKLKNEIKSYSNVCAKITKMSNTLECQSRKLEGIKNHYLLMDEGKKRQLMDIFKSAEVNVDFLKRRDYQLKELFKTTTDLTLKHDKVLI